MYSKLLQVFHILDKEYMDYIVAYYCDFERNITRMYNTHVSYTKMLNVSKKSVMSFFPKLYDWPDFLIFAKLNLRLLILCQKFDVCYCDFSRNIFRMYNTLVSYA